MQEEFIPFRSIGLCFSGGGYRATFFSLGVVSYLEKIHYQNKPLLQNVEAISTVSGGTLFGVAYTKAAQEEGFEFKNFFQNMYNSFEPTKDKLLETAIAKLNDDAVWKANPHKKRSLINAFALTYADMDIYKGDFSLYEKPPTDHLKHVCFNTTDFSFGLAFRFQNTGMFGNKPLNNTQVNNLKNEIALADIVASSSCFPLGFEPLNFPDDYIKNQQSTDYKSLKSLDRFSNGVGIMDGGIADNQGIGSMMKISRQRKSRKHDLDLMIINDVGSFKMHPWQPEPKSVNEGTTIKGGLAKIMSYFTVKPMYWILLVIGILLMTLNSMEIFKGQAWTALYILGGIITGIGILLTFFGVVAGILKGIVTNRIASLFNKNVPEPLVDDVLSFKKLSLGLVQRMLTERISSTVLMVNDVFLKQVRRLNYRLLYSDRDLRNKIITSTVYELNGEGTAYNDVFKYNKNITPAPSKLLKNVGLTASETPTTLWWDGKDIAKGRMDTLIACGQFTTCYKLIDYILKLKKSSATQDLDFTEIDILLEALLEDWKEFNKNPMFHVDALKT
ncbi:patatin-like phospholipase family protein [Kordia jejudonensis]|uniref:patatin-like phospholipase family protein n=1 Tax=Kordia jejudonensis TaxID=1348245 RepID=UPI000629848D|nr:patatin-like phospholipase family protein [Kordia jejudonensis]